MAVAFVNGDADRAANSHVGMDARELKKRRCEVREFKFPGAHVIAPREVTASVIAWFDDDWQRRGHRFADQR